MTLFLRTILFLSIFIAGAASANCPLPHHVTFHHHEMNGHSYGTWDSKNGWYQGTSDASGTISDGDHPVSFVKAIWFPYLDNTHGATDCYYVDAHGNTLTLFQQTGYGEVPNPSGNNWHDDTFGSLKALSCTTGTALCRFDFADRL